MGKAKRGAAGWRGDAKTFGIISSCSTSPLGLSLLTIIQGQLKGKKLNTRMSSANGERSNKRARYDADEETSEEEVISAGEGFFEALSKSHKQSVMEMADQFIQPKQVSLTALSICMFPST